MHPSEVERLRATRRQNRRIISAVRSRGVSFLPGTRENLPHPWIGKAQTSAGGREPAPVFSRVANKRTDNPVGVSLPPVVGCGPAYDFRDSFFGDWFFGDWFFGDWVVATGQMSQVRSEAPNAVSAISS